METVILNVSALTLVHEEKHESCGYQGAAKASIKVRAREQDIPAVGSEVAGSAVFALSLEVKDLVYVNVDPGDRSLHPIAGIFEYQGRGRLKLREGSVTDFA